MGVLFRLPSPSQRSSRRVDAVTAATGTTGTVSAFTPPADARRPLIGAATQVKIKDKAAVDSLRDRLANTAIWQREAYAAYESVGEVNYAFNLVANLISRCRVYVGAYTDIARPPTPVSEVTDLTPGLAVAAQAALDRLSRGSDSGISGMLYDLAINLSVAGEGYLVQIPEQTDVMVPENSVPESWSIRSVDEVVVTADSQVYLRSDRSIPLSAITGGHPQQAGVYKLPSDAYVGRIFRSSARFSAEPASSMRAVLPLVDELMLLNQMFRGTILSRMNAGLLKVPDGLSAAHTPLPAPTTDGVPGDPAPVAGEEDEFELDLIDAMTAPIADPASASSVVPLVVRGPADLLNGLDHMTFERSYDETLVQRAQAVLERIMTGIDLPKDVVSGLANVKYSNAIVIEADLLRSHIEPLALLICDAVTRAYLRPYLISSAFTAEQAERITLWFDPVDLASRPSRAQEANDGFDRYALSYSAWRRAHGFDETAAPDAREIVQRMMINKGQITPELTETLLRVVAPLMMEDARQANAAGGTGLPTEVQQALGLPPSQAAANEAAAPTPATGPPPPPPAPAGETPNV